MAEVFACQSLQSFRDIFDSEDALLSLIGALETPALASDVEDMFFVMAAYYFDALADIMQSFSSNTDYLYCAYFWILAGYWQNFAEMNYIDIPSGSIAPYVYPMKNYTLKENLTRSAITIAFAEAQGIDVELVEVDEPTMQALVDAVLAQDMADFGVLLHSLLLHKDATPDDILMVLLSCLLLGGNIEGSDVVSLADVLRTITSFPLEESFAELEKLMGLIGEELEFSDELIAAASRILENLIRHCLKSWETIDQEVGSLFAEEDDTLEYVLAWVTALYAQNFVALNAEEPSMVKAGDVVGKQERQERGVAVKKLVTENELDTVIESFSLDRLETYEIIDVDYVLDSYSKGEFSAEAYLDENLLLREAILTPIGAIATELDARISNKSSNEFAITEAVMKSVNGTMRSTGCTGCAGCIEDAFDLLMIVLDWLYDVFIGGTGGCNGDDGGNSGGSVQYAYSIQGDNKKPDASDVIFAYECFTNMGYQSYKSTYPAAITEAYIQNNINSEIILFSTHGWQNGVQIRENQLYVVDYDGATGYINIKDFTLNRPKLVVYSACQTAAGTDNLSKATCDKGADVVIGWTVNIGEAIYNWTDYFFTALKDNKTINEALNYADSFDYDAIWGSNHDNDDLKNNRKVYGTELRKSARLKIN